MENLKAAGLTFEGLKTLQGSSLAKKEYLLDNGCKLITQKKVSMLNKRVINTSYLHIQWTWPDGKVYYYREQKDGNFKGGRIS